MPVAALVMAHAPRPGGCNRGLEPLLGPQRCAELQAVLVRRAAEWAVAVAPGRAVVAYGPADAEEEMRRIAGAAEVWPQEDARTAARRAFERFAGPVLIARTDTPRLGPAHAAAALLDLGEGADVTIGPAHDGGWYLVGLRRPHVDLLASDAVADVLASAAEAELEVGLLRMERDLTTPADAAALAVDPLVPGDVRAALGS